MSSTVRVRFAPSPTGYLHVGGARTAYYNYLFAKKMGGDFILRIEDTDEARSTEDSLRMVIQDLKWLGLKWDEGPHPETLQDMGPFGPYRQSQRQDIYQKTALELLEKGLAYYCFLTDEEIDQQRVKSQIAGRPPQVVSPYADWTLEESRKKISAGGSATVRFKTKNLKKDYLLHDLVRGEVSFPSDMVGDFVILRSDGMPVYNFCCVVDDHLMKISHVLRAEEHLPNTLRQMMIYEAMSWDLPQFGHISLVLDEDRQKMSKRKGATSCQQFKEMGYLPEALKNFIVLLGWSHPEAKEILSEKDLIESFSVERLHSSGAVFDFKKLRWMNAQYLRALPNQELWLQIAPRLRAAGIDVSADPSWQLKSVDIFKSSMEVLEDAIELYRPLDDKHFVVHEESAEALKWEPTTKVLRAWRDLVAGFPEEVLSEADFLKLQDQVKEQTGAKGKNLFMPIRVAVIGRPQGTELKVLVPLMSKRNLLTRADQVLAQLGA